MPTSFTLVHAAGDMFMHGDRRHAIVTEACAQGDVVTLSEVIHDHAFIEAVHGFDAYAAGELGIMWRTDRFEKVHATHAQVMRGGRLGPLARILPRTFRRLRKARRGPSRLVSWVLLRDRTTAEKVLVFTHHAIAKADTAHKWRRPLRRQGFVRTAAIVKRVTARNPGVGAVLTGDLNTIGPIVAFRARGLRRVPTPATYGRLHYDRVYTTGATRVDSVTRFKTAGDHRALRARVTPNWKTV